MNKKETSNLKEVGNQIYQDKKMNNSENPKKEKTKVFLGGLSYYLFK